MVERDMPASDDFKEKQDEFDNLTDEPKEDKHVAKPSDDDKDEFRGLGKEEVLKESNKPVWRFTRLALLVLFWVVWVGMLVGAIVIIANAPRKCKAAAGATSAEKTAVCASEANTFDDMKKDLGDIAGRGFDKILVKGFKAQKDKNFGFSDSHGTDEKLAAFLDSAGENRVSVVVEADFVNVVAGNKLATDHEKDAKDWFVDAAKKDKLNLAREEVRSAIADAIAAERVQMVYIRNADLLGGRSTNEKNQTVFDVAFLKWLKTKVGMIFFEVSDKLDRQVPEFLADLAEALGDDKQGARLVQELAKIPKGGYDFPTAWKAGEDPMHKFAVMFGPATPIFISTGLLNMTGTKSQVWKSLLGGKMSGFKSADGMFSFTIQANGETYYLRANANLSEKADLDLPTNNTEVVCYKKAGKDAAVCPENGKLVTGMLEPDGSSLRAGNGVFYKKTG